MKSIVHICAHSAKNAGDRYLANSVKTVFEKSMGEIAWIDLEMQQMFVESDLKIFNESDAIVVGGGGHISINSFYFKEETGWSLGLTSDLIRKIEKPIIGYSIGYNLFRGEEMNNPIFEENMDTLLDASPFFSLRHTGDIGKLKKVMGESYDIDLNFCSSMVCEEYRPCDSDKIVIQLAGDQILKRFGSEWNFNRFIKNMQIIVGNLYRRGMKIYLVSHTNRDVEMTEAIKNKWVESKIDCEHINLVQQPIENMRDFYYGIDTVFAMRGHSQMIPIGLGCKIVSLISHDKIKFLLEDLGISSTGVEVNDDDFVNKCFIAYDNARLIDFYEKMGIVRMNIDSNIKRIEGVI
ncbi:MAG: polysaccharide pyruvyl transferase family protein [Synergistaceae bacterium]